MGPTQNEAEATKDRREVKFVDLFCGCGGLSLALTEAVVGYPRAQSVLGLDIMAEAEAVYLKISTVQVFSV